MTNRKNTAFTLIELLICVVIVFLLFAIFFTKKIVPETTTVSPDPSQPQDDPNNHEATFVTSHYRDHEYIIYRETSSIIGEGSSISVIHSPDCICIKPKQVEK